MSDTWLPFCVPELGPPAKRGYNGVPTRRLDEIEGEVKHSMEGTVAGAVGRLMTPLTNDPYTQASWHFSVPKVGKPRQHYALEAVCWHAGLPGDRRFDTSLVGNLTLLGEEHEDYPDNKLNANQVHWTIEISRAVRALCPRVAARPPTRRLNLWEHRELSATSCPSGLIPWDSIIAALEEDDMGMTPQQEAAFAALKARVANLEQKPYCIRSVSDPTVYFAAGGVLFSVRDGATWDKLKQLGYCGPDAKTLPDNHAIWKSPKVKF